MENRYVFSLHLKEGVDDKDLSEVGRLFHSLAAAIEKADCCFIVRFVQLCVYNLYWFAVRLSVGQSSSLVYCDVYLDEWAV